MKKGFTLLFAVLIISIMLSLSLTAATLIFSEIEFSILGRDSQIAFYAADTGIECALFWDLKQGAFAGAAGSINCAGQNPGIGSAPTYYFSLNFDNGSCVSVTVDKSNPLFTTITSRGYNTCVPESRYRVERALRVTY